MTGAPLARAAPAPAAVARPPAALARAAAPARPGRHALRLRDGVLPRIAWSIDRTGRTGLVGIALLLGAAVFLCSTHLAVVAEVAALRASLEGARSRARTAVAGPVAAPSAALPPLPARADMPAILRQLFSAATRARLAIDTGKYEVKETRTSGLVRYQIALPVTGPYPQIRAFLDTTLATMPAIALSDLALERKSVTDFNVDAQLRMTVYTVAVAPAGPAGAGSAAELPGRQASPRVPEALPASDRVALATHAAALFAQHSWTVLAPLPKLPPPPPPPPPPAPTAPPLPYTLVGSFAPAGDAPVFFLARGDRVLDAHVGDTLDGVYQLESAAGGQLVFVYLPLNIRQNLAAGAPK